MITHLRHASGRLRGRLARPAHRTPRAAGGFTLLELIIVIAIIGILAALAMPNLLNTPRRAKESVLKNNLRTIREVIDQYNADKGYYPGELEELVSEGYLREVPMDPITEERDWGVVYDEPEDDFVPAETDLSEDSTGPGIIDVYSLAEGEGPDGVPYGEW